MADSDQTYSPDLPIGERLRLAREAKGLSLDEVAGQTRIPVRHLQHIETGDWDALPAITYSVGFVRSYGNIVGLDGPALGQELRQQLGGAGRRPGPAPEYYEPADPARVPPRWLAITAVVIAVLLIGAYLVFRSGIDDGADVAAEEQKAAPVQQAAPQPQQPAQPDSQAAAGQPVTLTAQAPVWMRVSDGGRTVVERTLAAGESFQVPATAQAPVLRVGAPEALRVTVGQTQIPQLGPSGRPIGNVSLRAQDLVGRASGAAPQPAAPPAR
jgi:cytoskeletal protein RodZ